MKRALPLVVAVIATTLFTGTSAATAQASSAAVSQGQPDDHGKADPQGSAKGHDKDATAPKKTKKTKKPTAKDKTAKKKTTSNPGKAKGHDKDKGKSPRHDRPATGAPQAPGDRGTGNENAKVTFCHVPPGNPANGHVITTSVNAITPGHTNHSGDIIPPFSFVKHGSTVTFAGQNWDAAGQATLANGCQPVPASGAISAPADPTGAGTVAAPTAESTLETSPVGSPVEATPNEGTATDGPLTGISTTSASTDTSGDNGFVDGLLPNTGGARLALLLAGIALVAGGALLVVRRRAV